MSNARNLANLLGTNTKITTTDIADEVFQANKNIIINGAMQVSQRGTSETGITAGKYANAPDRFNLGLGSAGTWTAAQSTDAPVGFSNSYRLDCTTADASLGGGDLLVFQQAIEGQNLQHLKKGTSSAESVTVSFHVKSNKTGTYIAELFDADNSRQISQAYTISSANTWEKKTLTYAGDTSGALDNDNAVSLYFVCWLAAGSSYSSGTLSTSWTAFTQADRAVGQVNLADSTANDWSITGIQMELGLQSTPFEHRSYGDELKKCERYYQQLKALQTSSGTQTTQVLGIHQAATAMRASATVGSSGPLQVTDWGNTSKTQSSANIALQHSGNNDFSNRYYPIRLQNFTGLSQHRMWQLYNNTNYIDLDAEL